MQTECKTADDFMAWLKSSRVGDCAVYFVGTMKQFNIARSRKVSRELFDVVLSMAERNVVHAFQKVMERNTLSIFEYRAVRR